MAKNEEFVGKIVVHSDLGKVSVDSVEEGSRTKVNVTILDRGKGWNELKQSYKGVRNSVGWFRGENREFGKKDTVHIKDLELCSQ